MMQNNQKGAAVLAILAMVIIIFTASFIAGISLNKQNTIRKQANAIKLSKAKDALLGFAVSQSPPGLLPCPDTNGDGESNTSGSSCTTQLGFFPYKTLKLDELRDSSGAFFWYAPNLSYTESTSSLNSSVSTSLRFNTSIAIAAAIIAPGPIVVGQTRTNNNASEYLEGENADGDTSTYATNKSETNNDEVLPIYINEFWGIVEKRVLHTVGDALDSYKDTTNCDEYPWAADSSTPYNSESNLELGNLPSGAATASGGAAGCPTSLPLPTWFDPHWVGEIRYAFCGSSGSDCLSISGDLNQSGNALLLAPGHPLSGQTRPSTVMSNYFEDDNSDTDSDFVYRAQRNHDNAFNDTLYLFAP